MSYAPMGELGRSSWPSPPTPRATGAYDDPVGRASDADGGWSYLERKIRTAYLPMSASRRGRSLAGRLARLTLRVAHRLATFDRSRYARNVQLPRDFDAGYYLLANPDVAISSWDAADHYRNFGHAERRAYAPTEIRTIRESAANRSNPVGRGLVVVHDASRTGAPVAARTLIEHLSQWAPVSVLLLADGPMLDDFCAVSDEVVVLDARIEVHLDALQSYALKSYVGHREFAFAICISAESAKVLPTLSDSGLPIVSIIHEFTEYIRPSDKWLQVAAYSDGVIWSSSATLASFRSELSGSDEYRGTAPSRIAVQGLTLPDGQGPAEDLGPVGALPDGGPIVLAAGTAQMRKGVDLFLMLADALARTGDQLRIVWVGTLPWRDEAEAPWIRAHQRLAPNTSLHFLDDLPERALERLIAQSAVLVVPSRLDPLPNVAVTALAQGVPVVTFEGATGIPDLQEKIGLPRLTAPYLDVSAMAALVRDTIAAGEHPASRSAAERVRGLFDPDAYARTVREAVVEATAFREGRTRSAEIIAESGLLEDWYFGNVTGTAESSATLAMAHDHVRRTIAGHPRRPRPGFNPNVYRDAHPGSDLDPFADYILRGCPAGPWQAPVLRLAQPAPHVAPELERSTVLHIHAHYAKELRHLLERIAEDFAGSVVITGSDERILRAAEELLARRPFRSLVHAVPNIGRNFGGLQAVLASDLEFELVLHLHTKKTPSHSVRIVERWTSFLHANLLGHGDAPLGSLRRTLHEFQADPRLGLAFPSDPHVLGWGATLPYAAEIVGTEFTDGLPRSFDFPIGGMFLARRSALGFMSDIDVFPPEPIPYDGSALHALERLVGIIPAMDWNVLQTVTPPFTR